MMFQLLQHLSGVKSADSGASAQAEPHIQESTLTHENRENMAVTSLPYTHPPVIDASLYFRLKMQNQEGCAHLKRGKQKKLKKK